VAAHLCVPISGLKSRLSISSHQNACRAGFALDSHLTLRHFSNIKMIVKKHHFDHSSYRRNCAAVEGQSINDSAGVLISGRSAMSLD